MTVLSLHIKAHDRDESEIALRVDACLFGLPSSRKKTVIYIYHIMRIVLCQAQNSDCDTYHAEIIGIGVFPTIIPPQSQPLASSLPQNSEVLGCKNFPAKCYNRPRGSFAAWHCVQKPLTSNILGSYIQFVMKRHLCVHWRKTKIRHYCKEGPPPLPSGSSIFGWQSISSCAQKRTNCHRKDGTS